MKQQPSITPDALICDAIASIGTLEQSCHEVTQSHRVKIRKLRAFVKVALGKRELSRDELFDIGETLSPEIERLIRFPLAR